MESVTWSRSHIPGFSWFILETPPVPLPTFTPGAGALRCTSGGFKPVPEKHTSSYSIRFADCNSCAGKPSSFSKVTWLTKQPMTRIQFSSLGAKKNKNLQWPPDHSPLFLKLGQWEIWLNAFFLAKGRFVMFETAPPHQVPIGALVFKANKILAFTLSSVRASTHEIHMD